MPQKLYFSKVCDFWWVYYLGQCFDKLSLNSASCQAVGSTESVCTAIEQELRGPKTN